MNHFLIFKNLVVNDFFITNNPISHFNDLFGSVLDFSVELAWHSGSVMDCHATAQGSIPGGNSVFIELYVLSKGQ